MTCVAHIRERNSDTYRELSELTDEERIRIASIMNQTAMQAAGYVVKKKDKKSA